MGTAGIVYKGFNLLTRSYQLHESKCWTVHVEIRRNGRSQPFSLAERYQTEEEAVARCFGLGRDIIDGKVAGWSVNHLGPPGWSFKGEFLRQLVIAGVVISVLASSSFYVERASSPTTISPSAPSTGRAPRPTRSRHGSGSQRRSLEGL